MASSQQSILAIIWGITGYMHMRSRQVSSCDSLATSITSRGEGIVDQGDFVGISGGM